MSNVPFAAQLEELAAFFASKISVPTIGIGGGFAPIGTIIPYMGTTAPQDYLACDGTAYNIADYPQLASFIESQFGSKNYFGGNGTTTFAVPDLQGEFLRGTGTNSHTGQGNGANVGVHQDSTEVPAISYFGGSSNSYGNITVPRPNDSTSHQAKNLDKNIGSASAYNYAPATAGSSGNVALAYGIRPTNTSILYCIKAICAGEVYSTTEREWGTWIDGSVIYSLTVPTSGSIPSGATLLLRQAFATGYDFVLYTK